MPRYKPINIGEVFQRWTVLAFSHIDQWGCACWFCRCVCGVEKAIRASRLRNGDAISCGCFHQEQVTTHGHTDTATYRVWRGMISRCHNDTDSDFPFYGARGICVCLRWRESFAAFLEDMGEKPKGKTLDRWPNNDGNYEHSNCRWATPKQQARNRRDNHLITRNGKTLSLAEWADYCNIPHYVLRNRLKMGWSTERALTERVKYKKHPI